MPEYREMHLPMRTCVGCRDRAPQEDLIRLKLVGGKVVIARAGTDVPGRSIYLCRQEGCWRAALKRNSLTFKSSKHDRVVVRLDAQECEQLAHRLRVYAREERQQD